MRKFLTALALALTLASCGGEGRVWVHARTNEGTLILVPKGAELHHTWHYIEEDDPAWDCRVDGNRTCGTEIGTALTLER